MPAYLSVSDGFAFLRDQNGPNYLSAIAIPQTEAILETSEIRSRAALQKKESHFAHCCRLPFQGAESTGAVVTSVSHIRACHMILLIV